MRHFLTLFDIDQAELSCILGIGRQVKSLLGNGQRPSLLPSQVLSMLFEKPSLRTRVSFDAGFSQLGGSAMFLGEEVGWGKREPVADFIQVLANYVDFVVCRAKSHAAVEELASFNCVPIINGLTDYSHPCQALADLMTIFEHGGKEGTVITFVGDGNNVACSLALAAAMTGMEFRLLGPSSYRLPTEFRERIVDRYPGAVITETEDANEAMQGAAFVYTDVWTSMGQESETKQRLEAFAPFQLNSELMGLALADCKVLHCLPARRGEEVTAEVLDSQQSVIVQQAGNRMHAQKGLLLWLALQNGKLEKSQLDEIGVSVD